MADSNSRPSVHGHNQRPPKSNLKLQDRGPNRFWFISHDKVDKVGWLCYNISFWIMLEEMIKYVWAKLFNQSHNSNSTRPLSAYNFEHHLSWLFMALLVDTVTGHLFSFEGLRTATEWLVGSLTSFHCLFYLFSGSCLPSRWSIHGEAVKSLLGRSVSKGIALLKNKW